LNSSRGASSRRWRHGEIPNYEAIDVHIGTLVFDQADYDPDGDVLYLHVGSPRDAEGEETPEGHVLRFEPAPTGSSV
jgi:hypothetical protein